jgi:rare lipoprotein A (peptidoglycan hydrolase)
LPIPTLKRDRRVVPSIVVALAASVALGACAPGGPASHMRGMFSKIVPAQTASAEATDVAAADGVADGNVIPSERTDEPLTARPTRIAASSSDVAGRKYEAARGPGYEEVGLASWYGGSFNGRRTANGEIFDGSELSAAHPSLPLPSYVRVTNLDNNASIVVRVNDRGPYSHSRLIDVSERTAQLLDFHHDGTTRVRVEYVGEAPLKGDDSRMLLASYRAPAGGTMLASAAPRGRTEAVAFGAPEARGESAAMHSLTTPASVADRILVAFDVAGESY